MNATGCSGRFDFLNTVMYTRSLFRKAVWMQVAKNMSDTSLYLSDKENWERATFNALRKANSNVVKLSANQVELGEQRRYPLCVVLLFVHLTSPVLSNKTITRIVDSAEIYGDIDNWSRIVIQIVYKGLLKYNTDSTEFDEAVSLVVVDNFGSASGYNIPGGCASAVAYRCVALLLQKTGCQPSMIVNHVLFHPRILCDNYLYAMYVTAACVQVPKSAYCMDSQKESHVSWRYARPTRIIANLRFLILLRACDSKEIVCDLLLDEVNTLDSVRYIL